MNRRLFTVAALFLFSVTWMIQGCQKESVDKLSEAKSSTVSNGKLSIKSLKLLTSDLIDTLDNNRLIGYRMVEGSERRNIGNDSTEYTITMLTPYLMGDNGSKKLEYINTTTFLLSGDSTIYFAKFITNSGDSLANKDATFLNNGTLILKNLISRRSHIYSYSNGKAIKSKVAEAAMSTRKTMSTNALVCNTITTCNWYSVCEGTVYIYSNIPGQCSYPSAVTPCDYSAPWFESSLSYQTVCTDVPDPEAPGGGGGGGDGGGSGSGSGGNTGTGNPPSASDVAAKIANKPFALLNVDCETIKRWLSLVRFQVGQNELNRLNQVAVSDGFWPQFTHESVARVQNINDAVSLVVNMDYYPIRVDKMPIVNGQRLTPQQFLEYIRKNINSFVDVSRAEFAPYNWGGINDTQRWNSSNPLGSLVSIDMAGPDNGSVIVSQYGSNSWTFTTIYEPRYGEHPVTGNREFGFEQRTDGNYYFYTKGVDRLTGAYSEYLRMVAEEIVESAYSPYDIGDALWRSFQSKVEDFVISHGGEGNRMVRSVIRPQWSVVKDVIDGKRPLSTLSADCPD